MSYQVERDWMTKAGFRAVVVTMSDIGHRCGSLAAAIEDLEKLLEQS